ncbi:MAG: DUF4340 domain-containing protein [Halofilum sp. (in: g-proteobacteria)]
MRLRRSLNLVLAVAVIAGAGAAWYTGQMQSGPPPLTAVDPRDVETLELEFPGEERDALRLERRHDDWHFVEPIERAARDGRVVSALTVLAAPRRSCYPVAEHEPEEFGLDQPRLRMKADDTTVEFGDRAADGRRYVRAGDRFCLLPDQFWPLLKQGLDGLADPSILGTGTEPQRIATPDTEARLADDGDEWKLIEGTGDAKAWAARWRAARADAFILDPPAEDLGRIRIATGNAIAEWRIAAREPKLVLVPAGADYGIEIGADKAEHLLAPPADETDGGSS